MPRMAVATITWVLVILGALSIAGPATVGPTSSVPQPRVDLGSSADVVDIRDDDFLSGRNTPRPTRPSPFATTIPSGSSDPAVAPITVPQIPEGPHPLPFETLGRGYVTYYGHAENPGDRFAGGCLAIRDAETWTAFWDVHTWGISPPPSEPAVDFDQDMVLGCLLGVWTDCCSSYIEITEIWQEGGDYRVSVDAHRERGPLAMATSPYHLVRVDRTDGTVFFPLPEIPPVP